MKNKTKQAGAEQGQASFRFTFHVIQILMFKLQMIISDLLPCLLIGGCHLITNSDETALF